MKRIALLAVLMSVSSTAFAGSQRNGWTLNGPTLNGPLLQGRALNGLTANGRSANCARNNSLGTQGATLKVQASGEGSSGLKVLHASARNGRIFVR